MAPTAKVKITADPSLLPAGLRTAMGHIASFAKSTKAALAKMHLAPSVKKDWVGTAVGSAVGTMAVRGMDMLIQQGSDIFNFEEQLMRFGIVAHYNKEQLDGVRKSIRQVAEETGVGANDILAGSRAFADMAGASAFTNDKMRLMARTAQSAETDIKTLAEVMFQLQHSMKVPDNLLEETLGGIIETSKEGAVHFSAMAKEINELAPQAARYGMIGRDGVNQLTALMQVARTGFGSVSEMGTGITRVFSGLTMHAKRFREHGVEIFNKAPDGTKTWKTFREIFKAIRENNVLGKDPELLRKTFGRSEADRTIRLWMEGVDKLEQFEKAGMSAGVVQRDLATVTASSWGKIQIAINKVKNDLADALTPERIDRFANAISNLATKFQPIASSIGAIIDGYNKVYEFGRDIRDWMSDPQEKPVADLLLSAEHRQKWADRYGMDPNDIQGMQDAITQDWDRMRALVSGIKNNMGGDGKPNARTDEAAVRAWMNSRPGSFEHNAAQSYLEKTGMTPESRRKIEQDIKSKYKYFPATDSSRTSSAWLTDLEADKRRDLVRPRDLNFRPEWMGAPSTPWGFDGSNPQNVASADIGRFEMAASIFAQALLRRVSMLDPGNSVNTGRPFRVVTDIDDQKLNARYRNSPIWGRGGN